jgi:hypothetical protein
MIKRIKDYPKSVRIRDADYEVKFCRQIPGEPPDTVGLCDDELKIIWMRLRQKPRERFKTLCHEIAHGFEREWGIRIPHKLIYAIEEPIARLLEDNV